MGRPARIACAVIVLAAAAALRLTGLAWLLPESIEQDPHIPIQVRLMEGGSGEPPSRLDWGAYPHLVARLTTLLTPREDREPPAGELDLAEQLARARWPVQRVRLVVALLSLLAVPATWALARRWLPPSWSLLAAALVASSLLALHFGAQARAHGAAVGLVALAVLACLRLRERGDAASYLLAGLAVAAAIACLQSGVATLLPLAAAHIGLVRERRAAARATAVSRGAEHAAVPVPPRARGAGHLRLLLPAACVALSLAAFWPFLFQPSAGKDAARLAVDENVLLQAKHQVFLDKFNGAGFLLLGRDLWHWEPALVVAAACAALAWLARRRGAPASPRAARDRAVVLAYVVPYAFVIGLYARSYERFLLPLVPFLAVFASWGLAQLAGLVRSPAPRRAAGALLAAAVLAFPVAVAVQLVALRRAPSTIDLAADWVRTHVAPDGERVLSSRAFSLPLFRTLPALEIDAKARPDYGLGWSSYQLTMLRNLRPREAWNVTWIPYASVPALEASLTAGVRRWVAALPADLVVNDVSAGRGIPAMTVITQALRETSEGLARFSPDADPASEVPLVFQDETTGPVPPMAWRVLHAERFGPVIEIYRIPRSLAGLERPPPAR